MRSYIPHAATWSLGGIAAASALPVMGLEHLAIPAGAAGVGVGAGIAVVGHRNAQREELKASCVKAIKPLVGEKATVLLRKWKGWPGTPGKVVIRYSPLAKDNEPNWKTTLVDTISRRLGVAAEVTLHDKKKRYIVIEATQPQESDSERERIARTVGDLMGSAASVTNVVRDDEGNVTRIEVAKIPTTKLAAAGYRTRVERTFSTVHTGRWRCHWDLQNDRMRFEIRPEFPTLVRLPQADVDPRRDVLSSYDKVKIPYGVDEDGNELAWRPAIDPNLMVVGSPGTGKTVFEHGILATVSQYGWPIWVLDGKAVEFLGWRTWPNVQIVASRVEEQLALIERAQQLMEHRYHLINTGQASEDDFEPLMVFVDEWADFRANLLAWYVTNKGKGAPAKPPVLEKVASIARKGRTSRIHLLFATQRPDADYFGGDMRDNFRARISMGRLSPQGAMMMWQDPSVGTAVPRGCRGRATTINDHNQVVEVQTYFVQDPRKTQRRPTPEDVEHLERLTPAPELSRHERLLIMPPEQNDEEETLPGYQAWCKTRWVRAADYPELDPAKARTIDPEKARQMASPMSMFGLASAAPAAVPAETSTEDLSAGSEGTAFDDYPAETFDPTEGYGPAQAIDPMGVEIGDLIELEDGIWVTVDQEPEEDPFNPGAVSLCWRDDEGNEGVYSIGWTDSISTRRPALADA